MLFSSCQQSLPGASAQWRQGLADALAGGHSLCDLDTLTAGHGRAEWLRWRFLPWHLPPVQPGGAPQGGVLLFCEIITLAVENSRKLEEQARQLHSANVDMRNVSLALSHDLQAPVRQMVKFAQLLDADSGAALDGSSRDFLAEIHAAGARMQRMIAGLLRYLRIASRQPALYPVETGEAVAAALANLRHDIDATQAQVSVGPLPNIQGDAQLLTLLFQNLVQNSLKYAARAALHIEIAARRDGDTWKITCRDNGPGIALHGAGKAFDLFQRLDDRKDIAGTGVGLAICRWIAEVHAGTLEIIAAAGPGLCLSLTLPVAASQAPVSSGAPV